MTDQQTFNALMQQKVQMDEEVLELRQCLARKEQSEVELGQELSRLQNEVMEYRRRADELSSQEKCSVDREWLENESQMEISRLETSVKNAETTLDRVLNEKVHAEVRVGQLLVELEHTRTNAENDIMRKTSEWDSLEQEYKDKIYSLEWARNVKEREYDELIHAKEDLVSNHQRVCEELLERLENAGKNTDALLLKLQNVNQDISDLRIGHSQTVQRLEGEKVAVEKRLERVLEDSEAFTCSSMSTLQGLESRHSVVLLEKKSLEQEIVSLNQKHGAESKLLENRIAELETLSMEQERLQNERINALNEEVYFCFKSDIFLSTIKILILKSDLELKSHEARTYKLNTCETIEELKDKVQCFVDNEELMAGMDESLDSSLAETRKVVQRLETLRYTCDEICGKRKRLLDNFENAFKKIAI
jgi:hypothetical protein